MNEAREDRKREAAREAVKEVTDGAVVGLGSGSTAAYAIRELGSRIDDGLDVVGIPTSHQAADVARAAGVPVRIPADVEGIDLAIDGADQVAGPALIKGGGGAHAREKVIDAAASAFLVVVDDEKLAESLNMPVPVEVLPDARPLVAADLRQLGGDPDVRRRSSGGPETTDNGNHVIDCDFGRIVDPGALATALDAIPGVLEHGLFLDLADTVYIAHSGGVRVETHS